MNSLQRSPALLTRSEIDYLLNKKHVDPNYEYVIRHRIKEKLDRFIQLEIPLLEKASFLQNLILSNCRWYGLMGTQYPELFSNYLEFCGYRTGFIKTSVINLRKASFFHPTTLLPVLNLVSHLKNIIEPEDNNVRNYLLTILGKDLESSDNKSYIPLVTLPAEPNECGSVLQRMYQLIRTEVFGGEQALKYVVSELVDNIYQHSYFTKAMVMAQRYDSRGFTDLGLFDDGITIAGSFAKHGMTYSERQSFRAISDAIAGLSSKGGIERGYGLSSSVRIFLEGLEGQVLIVSGDGAVYMSKEEKYAYNLTEPYKLKGTLISLRVQNQTKQIDIYNYVE